MTWTIKALLDWITPYLRDKEVDGPRLCAELLVCHVLGKQRIELYTQFDQVVTPAQLEPLRGLVKRAAEHEPVAYLVGRTEFYSLEMAVAPGCLIPRPETEMLVQHAVETLRLRPGAQAVLDLCTGSGCIAVAVAANHPETRVLATDLSAKALEIAQRNVARHGLAERVTLAQGDLFEPARGRGPFDLILCNPPYVSQAEYEALDRNVKAYEPAEALLAGPEGLDLYQRLFQQVADHLKPDAAILIEIGYRQGPAVRALAEQTGLFDRIRIEKDFQHHDRLVIGKRKL